MSGQLNLAPELPPAMHTTFVPFTDYSQWERRPHKPPEVSKTLPLGKSKAKPKSFHSQVTGSSSKKTIQKQNPNTKESAVIIRNHPQEHAITKRGATRCGTRVPSHQSKSAANIRLLKLQIAARKVCVEDFRHYKKELFSANLALMQSIQNAESSIHSDVDRMLEKYTSFKGAISKLKSKSSDIIEEAKEELERTRAKLEAELIELDRTVHNTEQMALKKTKELNMLLNYKDKEFPLQSLKVEQLKEQCELLKESNEADLTDMELQIAEEWDKYEQVMDCVRKDLETRAAQESLATMKKSVHEKAIQNRIMEKELIIHEKKRSEFEEAVATLKSNIKRLSGLLEKKNKSRHKSPISMLGKCLPNTELQLEFPRQQEFPL